MNTSGLPALVSARCVLAALLVPAGGAELILPQGRNAFYSHEPIEVAVAGLGAAEQAKVEFVPAKRSLESVVIPVLGDNQRTVVVALPGHRQARVCGRAEGGLSADLESEGPALHRERPRDRRRRKGTPRVGGGPANHGGGSGCPTPTPIRTFMYEIGRPWGCTIQFQAMDTAGDKIFLASLWGEVHVYDSLTGNRDTILSCGRSNFYRWKP